MFGKVCKIWRVGGVYERAGFRGAGRRVVSGVVAHELKNARWATTKFGVGVRMLFPHLQYRFHKTAIAEARLYSTMWQRSLLEICQLLFWKSQWKAVGYSLLKLNPIYAHGHSVVGLLCYGIRDAFASLTVSYATKYVQDDTVNCGNVQTHTKSLKLWTPIAY